MLSMIISSTCKSCSAQFEYDSYPSWPVRVYCSRKCSNSSTKNWEKLDHSKQDLSHLKRHQYKKGAEPWNKGKTGYKVTYTPRDPSPASIDALRKAAKARIGMPEQEHPSWRGDDVGYQALHQWVAKHLGRPSECSNPYCEGESKTYDWANRSGEYRRDLGDWVRLCRVCHTRYDKGWEEYKELIDEITSAPR